MARADTVRAPEKENSDIVDKTPPTFTIDDLLAELKADDIPDGVTTKELCERNGQLPTKSNISKAGRRVYDLVVTGRWECVGKKPTVSVTGETRMSPAYRPKGGGD